MPKCKITVLKCHYFPELTAEYCLNPDPGLCPVFKEGDTVTLDLQDYYNLVPQGFCSEAWHAISHYVYAAIQGGSIMEGWMKQENTMIACCNDGTRPVVFKLERIDSAE